MPNRPTSRQDQAWEIYLVFLTGRSDGDEALARSAFKAADDFEKVIAEQAASRPAEAQEERRGF